MIDYTNGGPRSDRDETDRWLDDMFPPEPRADFPGSGFKRINESWDAYVRRTIEEEILARPSSKRSAWWNAYGDTGAS